MPEVHRDIVAPTHASDPRDIVLTLPPKDADGHSEFQVNGVPFWKATPFLARVGDQI